MTFRAAFYKSTHPGLPGVYNRLVRWWTRSEYSHVELIFIEGPKTGRCLAASSSAMDGGVRSKVIDFDPALWDFVDLPDQLWDQAWTWFCNHDGAAYDYLGNVPFVLSPVAGSKRKWFCSEAVAAALGIPDPGRFDPGTLHAALTFLTKPASSGLFTAPT